MAEQLNRAMKLALTAALYLIFFGSGITYNIVAPTLRQLGHGLNATLVEVSAVYTSRSAGYIVGAPLAALIFARLNRQLVIGWFVALMAVTAVILPRISTLLIFYITAFLSGLSSGVTESGVNVWLLELWTDKSCPWMQALHLCFALGCATGPILAAPFLNAGQIHVPYLINGIITIFAASYVWGLYAYRPYKMLTPTEDPKKTGRGRVTAVVVLACLTMLFYSGQAIAYAQFLPTALSAQGLAADRASLISAVMYYAATLSRAVSIPLAVRVPPQWFVVGNCGFLLSGSVLMLVARRHEAALWTGNILIGLGSSSMSAPLYSFLKRHGDVTQTVGSAFVFCSGLTSILYPILLGQVLDANPECLLYLNIGSTCLTLLCFALVLRKIRGVKTDADL